MNHHTRLTAFFLPAALLLASAGFAAESAPPPPTKAVQTATSPEQALASLTAGNARFVAGKPLARDWAAERRQTAAGQFPVAAVISCIDSRVSSEVIFDQGLGALFNARIAGNIVDEDILGSVEFACKLAGARLIAVIGHTHCGAIKGACSGAELGNLTGLLAKIQPAVAAARKQAPAAAPSDPAFVEKVAEENVREVLRQIPERSAVLRELIAQGKVGLVGGIYDLDSGQVHFFSH